MNELDIRDRKSIIYFGSSAQEKLDEISNRMIDGVQNKDLGAAGDALSKMVASIRGFDIDEFNPNKSVPWWKKLFGAANPLVEFVQEYEKVRDQIDLVANDLEKHKSQLMSDIVALDKLYDAWSTSENWSSTSRPERPNLKSLKRRSSPSMRRRYRRATMI